MTALISLAARRLRMLAADLTDPGVDMYRALCPVCRTYTADSPNPDTANAQIGLHIVLAHSDVEADLWPT